MVHYGHLWNNTVLHCSIRFEMLPCGLVRAFMVLHGPMSSCTVLYGLLWCTCMFLYGHVWSYLILHYNPIWFGVFLYGFVRFCTGLYFRVLIRLLRSYMVMWSPIWPFKVISGLVWILEILYGLYLSYMVVDGHTILYYTKLYFQLSLCCRHRNINLVTWIP